MGPRRRSYTTGRGHRRCSGVQCRVHVHIQALRCRLSASSLQRRRVVRAGAAAPHRPVRRGRACRVPKISNGCRGCREPRPRHERAAAWSDRHRFSMRTSTSEMEGGDHRARRSAAARARPHRKRRTGTEMPAEAYRRLTFTPQLSLNFGTGDGWSYISGGLGPSIWSIVPDGAQPLPADDERLRHLQLRRRRAAGSRRRTLPCTSTSASM